MGASYVVAATRWSAHLHDHAFRVLVKIAVTVLDIGTDDVPAGEFFGNVSDLAAMIKGSGSAETKQREVRRAITDLTNLGILVPMNKPRRGVRQRYRLTILDAGSVPPEVAELPKKRRGKGGLWVPAQGDSTPNTEGDSTPNTEGDSTPEVRGTVPALRKEEEPLHELEMREGVDLVASPTDARDPEPHEHEEIPSHSHVAVADPRCSYHGMPNTAPAGGPHRCRFWPRDGMCGKPKPVPLDPWPVPCTLNAHTRMEAS